MIKWLLRLFEKEKEVVETKEDYYNNKYPKENVTYTRTDKLGSLPIDVRQFLNKNDFNYPVLIGEDDEKALESLEWIIDNINYTPDASQYKINEYWSFGYETLKHLKGDCEDGAILLYNIMRYNGIPAWKIRVTAGWVINPNTLVKEGHAYVTYYCEESDKWVVLDWCYLPEREKIKDREDYKNEAIYGQVWFSFNEDYSWSKGINEEKND